ncbi:mitogen-activated protein kinase 15 isoform X2 [Agrilus planipennis]|nr:mitogen-activated protein kinase 15 isoform X2 [Agrilus planipennis]XP_018322947.1 mitogen-activated protein kinase 15 isoform X2 [Agrilus planipennis]XP_018322948.1 mitogen-activated protein kinase 15 isoform X2 [Agrilus planipennis]
METDLHNVIKRGNILKDIHKRYIMYQLLKAIKYIHSGDVIHRDLKPSNVLLDSMCRCKLADFGLARSLTQCSENSPDNTDPTLTDYVATRWYRAPEILIANRNYTKGIDMWSIGCILGEMLLGKPIFPGTSTVNQVERIMSTIESPSSEDISAICVSGVGTSMIKNATAIKHTTIKAVLGPNVVNDGLELVLKLLVFNPYKRYTAEQALSHNYVSRFHNPSEEKVMLNRVTPPLNDDVRLSVDDYRNKLYEIMTVHHNSRSGKIIVSKAKTSTAKTDVAKPEVKSKVYKETDRYLRNHRCVAKETPYQSQSEPKFRPSNMKFVKSTLNIKSDSKIPKDHQDPKQSRQRTLTKSQGDSSNMTRMSDNQNKHSSVNLNRDKQVRKRIVSRGNSYTSSFINNGPGVITQSALMELRAAGMR